MHQPMVEAQVDVILAKLERWLAAINKAAVRAIKIPESSVSATKAIAIANIVVQLHR